MQYLQSFLLILLVSLLQQVPASGQTAYHDVLTFGNAASESSHRLVEEKSNIITGGLKQPARVLFPKSDTAWEGGTVDFEMTVDPAQQNYFTAKFWGSDRDKSMLLLFCEGKQVGYRHLGDIDLLWLGNGQAPFSDRFFYITLPLPLQITKGKSKVALAIRSYGDIWAYGENFAQYQRKMAAPSLGIYNVYTHTTPAFVPLNEVQGKAKDQLKKRENKEEVMDALKLRVNKELLGILSAKRPLNQQEIMFLAPAYSVKWTAAYQNTAVVDKTISSIDAYCKTWLSNPKILFTDKAVYNPEWLLAGPLARTIRQLWTAVSPHMDENTDNGKGQMVSRRTAWSVLLQEHVRYSTTHRRHYTNQSMIIDLFLYDANKALQLIDPKRALPEAKVMDYLYQSVGLKPWLGKETPTGPEKPLGDNYWQLTDKGLTKELGFVGYYGEVLDWVVDIYKATCKDGMPGSGDEKIKRQLLKMMEARSYFRYPEADDEGYKAMKAEAVVGWRDGGHYPGDILYGDRGIAWDASPLMTAAATLDPKAVGFAQQMIDDNQFFNLLHEKLKLGGIRVTKSLLHVPDEYELIRQQPPSSYQLPMSPSMRDFVFADEEDGVLAIKNGTEILYASLYWRARNAVNRLAKIHYITPVVDRIANIYIRSEFDSSGMHYTRPDWVNLGFQGNREWYTGIHSVHAGEVLPIAKIPEGVKFTPGDENVYAGKAAYYQMEYGDYLVAMNTTKERTFELTVPEAFRNAKDLCSRTTVGSIKSLRVQPRTTVVLFKGAHESRQSMIVK